MSSKSSLRSAHSRTSSSSAGVTRSSHHNSGSSRTSSRQHRSGATAGGRGHGGHSASSIAAQLCPGARVPPTHMSATERLTLLRGALARLRYTCERQAHMQALDQAGGADVHAYFARLRDALGELEHRTDTSNTNKTDAAADATTARSLTTRAAPAATTRAGAGIRAPTHLRYMRDEVDRLLHAAHQVLQRVRRETGTDTHTSPSTNDAATTAAVAVYAGLTRSLVQEACHELQELQQLLAHSHRDMPSRVHSGLLADLVDVHIREHDAFAEHGLDAFVREMLHEGAYYTHAVMSDVTARAHAVGAVSVMLLDVAIGVRPTRCARIVLEHARQRLSRLQARLQAADAAVQQEQQQLQAQAQAQAYNNEDNNGDDEDEEAMTTARRAAHTSDARRPTAARPTTSSAATRLQREAQQRELRLMHDRMSQARAALDALAVRWHEEEQSIFARALATATSAADLDLLAQTKQLTEAEVVAEARAIHDAGVHACLPFAAPQYHRRYGETYSQPCHVRLGFQFVHVEGDKNNKNSSTDAQGDEGEAQHGHDVARRQQSITLHTLMPGFAAWMRRCGVTQAAAQARYAALVPSSEQVWVSFGEMPEMVKGARCALRDVDARLDHTRALEEQLELGGYFVLRGGERIVRALLMQRCNVPINIHRERFTSQGPHFSPKAVVLRCKRASGLTVQNYFYYTALGDVVFSFARKVVWHIPVTLLLAATNTRGASALELYGLLTAGAAAAAGAAGDGAHTRARVEALLQHHRERPYGALTHYVDLLAVLGRMYRDYHAHSSTFHFLPQYAQQHDVRCQHDAWYGLYMLRRHVLPHLNADAATPDLPPDATAAAQAAWLPPALRDELARKFAALVAVVRQLYAFVDGAVAHQGNDVPAYQEVFTVSQVLVGAFEVCVNRYCRGLVYRLARHTPASLLRALANMQTTPTAAAAADHYSNAEAATAAPATSSSATSAEAMRQLRELVDYCTRRSGGGGSGGSGGGGGGGGSSSSSTDALEVVHRLLTTGNLTLDREEDFYSPQSSGWVVMAEHLNFYRFFEQLRCVHRGKTIAEMRSSEVRKYPCEAYGFLCMVHSPDGEDCGVLNHLSVSTVLSGAVLQTGSHAPDASPSSSSTTSRQRYDNVGNSGSSGSSSSGTALLSAYKAQLLAWLREALPQLYPPTQQELQQRQGDDDGGNNDRNGTLHHDDADADGAARVHVAVAGDGSGVMAAYMTPEALVGMVPVWVEGELRGYVLPAVAHAAALQLRARKALTRRDAVDAYGVVRRHVLSPLHTLEVVYVPPGSVEPAGLYVFFECGRLMRPVQQIESVSRATSSTMTRRTRTQSHNDDDEDDDDEDAATAAEMQQLPFPLVYIGTWEQTWLDVAAVPSDLLDAVTQLNRKYTYMEQNGSNLLSLTATTIPFFEYNCSPRNLFQCGLSKQSAGTQLQALAWRKEAKLFRMYTPQRYLSRTLSMDSYHLDEVNLGVNAVVAILAYTGYDMDDAVVLNHTAAQRGMLNAGITVAKVVTASGRSSGGGEASGDVFVFHNMLSSGECFSAELNGNGLPRKRVAVSLPSVGATTSTSGVTRASDADAAADDDDEQQQQQQQPCHRAVAADASDSRFAFSSAYPALNDNSDVYCCARRVERVDPLTNATVYEYTRHHTTKWRHFDKGERAWLHAVVPLAYNGPDVTVALLVFRIPRPPAVGDKFSSRHGQKGTLPLHIAALDLPYAARSGVTPDVLINPHAFPSRMTVGMVLEIMAGKLAAVEGHFVDNSAWSVVDERPRLAEELGDALERAGYNRYGRERLIDGISGEEMEAEVFVGVSGYQRLRHMVSDKWQARARTDAHTHRAVTRTGQPVKGRKRHGGVRVGEMERDGLLSHGLSEVVLDRLLHVSDKTRAFICPECGGLLSIYERHATEYSTWKTCRFCGAGADESSDTIAMIEIPQVLRLWAAELTSIGIRVAMKADETAS